MPDPCDLLLGLLRNDAGWPLPDAGFEDLTFSYRVSEIQFLRNESAQVARILQLRPLPGLPRTVFIVDEGAHDLSRFAVRRVGMHFSTRPKHLAPRPYFPLESMVFLVLSSEDQLSIAHMQGSHGLSAPMAVLGPEPLSDSQSLMNLLRWPNICSADWRFKDHHYLRHDRSRHTNRCSAQFIDSHCPEFADLFRTARSTEPLSQAEEDRLFAHAQAGAAWAIERIVQDNLRHVFDMAYRQCTSYSACQVPFAEAFSGGIEGLMIAINKYEVVRGHRFAAFAWQWIASRIDRAFAEGLWPINVPYYLWTKVSKFCRTQASEPYGSPSSALAEDASEVVQLLTWQSQELVSVDTLDQLPDPASDISVDALLTVISLPDQLTFLQDREREVLLLRSGLHPRAWGEEFTLDEIGALLNVSRERVRQIEIKARKKVIEYQTLSV